MNLKTGISASLFLHSLLIIPLLFAAVTVETEQGEIPATEVELTEAAGQEEKIVVLEKGDEPSENKVENNFYYGIGVQVSEFYSQFHGRNVKVVSDVYSGYSAEEAGILVHDVILAVNGKEFGDVYDIKGSSPGRISLTIFRNETIIVINLDRVKVYY